MKKLTFSEESKAETIEILGEVSLFEKLNTPHLATILKFADLLAFDSGEVMIQKGSESKSFFLVLKGEVSIYVERSAEDRKFLTSLGTGHAVGEIGVLLQKPSSITAIAGEGVQCLRFGAETFFGMFQKIPDFGLAAARSMAHRIEDLSGQVALPQYQERERTERRVTDLLPLPFLQRHQVLPVRQSGNRLTVGFVNEPTSAVLDSIYKQLPGMEIQPVRIHSDYFNGVLQTRVGVGSGESGVEASTSSLPKELEDLLQRVVAEGASDLHLSEGMKPRWRIDGDLHTMEDARFPKDLAALFDPVLEPRHKQELEQDQDTDFGCNLGNVARFRVNLYRDHHGVNAGIRQIPSQIMDLESLGYPETIKQLCAHPKGLVLVTGPTGSGKSTTLAAMIDHINQNYSRHIITLEDPIEFVHQSKRAMIHQRELGSHTSGFQRGLQSAMRQDPDVVLVGEILDRETMNLAMDTASTGHLVFATMHTNSAAATVDRIVDMFPNNQHAHIRTVLSDIMVGVISQTLCKRNSGGRVAALEIMVVNRAVRNLIREGKTVQIPTIMQSGKKDGHILLDDSLAQLVAGGKVIFEEALAKTTDRKGLASRCKKSLPGE